MSIFHLVSQSYQIGDGTIQMRIILNRENNKDKQGIACKITIPIGHYTNNLEFKSSPLIMDYEESIEYWEETDHNLFVSKILIIYHIYIAVD